MDITKEEFKEIVKEVLEEVSRTENFHMDAEKHYNQHKTMDRLLDMYEKTTNGLIRTLVAVAVFGIVALIGVVKYFSKGGS